VTATSVGAKDSACRAAPGVAANIAANGKFTLNQSDLQGVSGYDTGNPNLKAEKGRSTTIGLVVTPRSIPMLSKFTFTADYFNIKIADAIVSTPRQYALDQCYGGGNTSFCDFIVRRPANVGANSAGSIQYSNVESSNSGGEGTEGIDLTASWADKVGPGRLSTNVAYTYLKTLWNKATPDADKDESAGELDSAKNKMVWTIAYKWGAVSASTTLNYIGRSSLDDQFLKEFDLPANSVRVGSRTYTSMQLTYTVKKSVDLYFGMDNVFDIKAPPIISGLPGDTTGTETDASTYDAIGRRFYGGVRISL